MARRRTLLRVGFVGAMLMGSAFVLTDARAQQGCCQRGSATGANAWTAGNATSAQWPLDDAAIQAMTTGIAQPPANGSEWWTHGELEFGGQGFLNNPTPGGSAYLNQQSLAKFYEYGIAAPDPFGGGHIAAGTKDGVYQVDLWANDIASYYQGFSDQSYLLTASKIGEQYFTFQFDQTPHIYSTSAQTPYNGVGSTLLTLPATVAAPLSNILPFLHPTDIGIERDTTAAHYRWTPSEPWDFNADYSLLSRSGTQTLGGVVGIGAAGPPGVFSTAYVMVPTPVNDTTQNYSADGEYLGTSWWGQKYTIKLGYNGSQYHDSDTSYVVQNPITSLTTPFARESMWPNNQANGVGATLAADLPAASRYVGTVNYTNMTQNSAFIPMSMNFNLALPRSSLDGDINTILVNNVLTSKITPALTNKLSYQFYDFDNETPQILFSEWVWGDNNSCCAGTGTIQSLTMKYEKQNAGEALNWRPSEQWNFNAAYGFEHYDYWQTDASSTNESTGKLSADWKPTTWLTARASGYFGYRRADNYNYDANVAWIQFPISATPTPTSWYYSPAYRQLMFDNRQQTKAQFALDVVAFRGVTITPTIKYQDDYYGLNPLNQEGLTDNKTLSWGVDTAYLITPELALTASYYQEYLYALMYGLSAAGNPSGPADTGMAMTSDKTTVNTVTAGVTWTAIPDKLDFDVHLALSQGIDAQRLLLGTGLNPSGGPFPNDETWFEHLDAVATYKFDQSFVRQMGWMGDVKAKLRYTWERNGVNNWQNDGVAPYFFPGTATAQNAGALFMAADNPNYNVHMLAGSLIASW